MAYIGKENVESIGVVPSPECYVMTIGDDACRLQPLTNPYYPRLHRRSMCVALKHSQLKRKWQSKI